MKFFWSLEGIFVLAGVGIESLSMALGVVTGPLQIDSGPKHHGVIVQGVLCDEGSPPGCPYPVAVDVCLTTALCTPGAISWSRLVSRLVEILD